MRSTLIILSLNIILFTSILSRYESTINDLSWLVSFESVKSVFVALNIAFFEISG